MVLRARDIMAPERLDSVLADPRTSSFEGTPTHPADFTLSPTGGGEVCLECHIGYAQQDWI